MTSAGAFTLYAIGCAIGLAAALGGALQGVVFLLALYVLESSRGASVEMWLATWSGLPAWGALVSSAAALAGGWLVSSGAWGRPALARLLLVAIFGAAVWLGAWTEDLTSWLVNGIGLSAQVAAGWWIAGQLSRWAQEAQQGQIPPGEAVHEARTHLVSIIGGIVFAWAMSTIAPVPMPRWELSQGVAVAGMAVGLLSSVLYMMGLQQLWVRAELAAAKARIDPGFWLSPPRWLIVAVAAVIAVAAALPSDPSPVHIRDFNRWMEALTERIGPWLVPSARLQRSGGEGIWDRLADIVSETLLPKVLDAQSDGPWSLVGQIFLLGLLFLLGWRILRRRNKPVLTSTAVGRVPLGLRWLLQEVGRALKRLLQRFGFLARHGAPASGTGPKMATFTGPRRGIGLRSRLPDSVIPIYLHVIERLGERGLRRQPSETPLEFLGRWRKRSKRPDERGLPVLTRLFLLVRYAGKPQQASMIAEARRAAILTLRGWRREVLLARIRSWTGARNPTTDQ